MLKRCFAGSWQDSPSLILVAPGSLQSIWLTTRRMARGNKGFWKAQTAPPEVHEPMEACSFPQMCRAIMDYDSALLHVEQKHLHRRFFRHDRHEIENARLFTKGKVQRISSAHKNSESTKPGIGCGRKRQSHLWRAGGPYTEFGEDLVVTVDLSRCEKELPFSKL